MTDVEVRETVAAAPDAVYALVSDVTRMGEWSPGEGCTVVESWTDRRSKALQVASMPLMGVVDPAAHNHRGMVATLAALKRTAEAG